MRRKAGAAALRRRAETRLRERRKATRPAAGASQSRADTQRLLHELQVHQVELEMQNAELQEARDGMEALLEKYTDLYDCAPVGYFSVDGRGRILEANLTGAALLGVERSRLINQRLSRFMAPSSRPAVLAFLDSAFVGPGKQVCEAALLTHGGAPLWVHLHAAPAAPSHGPERWCRVTAADITALKRAEEAERRTQALAAANRDLQQEIVRRQAVEAALKDSERHQSRLLEQSRQMEAHLRHLSHQVLQAQEEERKRISRELHDEVTQTLVGINVHLEALARGATVDPPALKKKILRTQRLVEKAVNMVLEFARELRPALLDDFGLTATLRAFLKDFTKRTGIRAHLTGGAAVDRLDGDRRTVLYRVVQSTFANVAQHAHATRVSVRIRRLRHAIRMEIADNGVSFDVGRASRDTGGRHLGLLGMRERVEMVGGSLSIASSPGRGTTIQAHIPFAGDPARGGGAHGQP